MRPGRLLAALTLGLVLASVGAASASTSSAKGGTLPAQIRAATAKYHSLSAAQDAGWNQSQVRESPSASGTSGACPSRDRAFSISE